MGSEMCIETERNPTTSERLCGLSRLLRGYATAMLEDVALWHERDLAHSSVERVALVDSLTVGHYQAVMAGRLVETLEVFPDRMRAAVDHTRGLVHSSAVLADLLSDGMEREKAYRVVQSAATRTVTTGQQFAAALAEEGIDAGGLDPARFLGHHDVIFERLEELR